MFPKAIRCPDCGTEELKAVSEYTVQNSEQCRLYWRLMLGRSERCRQVIDMLTAERNRPTRARPDARPYRDVSHLAGGRVTSLG